MWLKAIKRPAAVTRSIAGLATLLAASLALGSGALGAEAPPSKSPIAVPAPKVPRVKQPPLTKPGPGVQPTLQMYSYAADLERSVKRQRSVPAAGVRWTCIGRRCTRQAPWPTPQVDACRALAEVVGKIRAYGRDSRKLSRSQLEQCNAGVGKVARKKKDSRDYTAVRPQTSVRGESRALQLWRVPSKAIRDAATIVALPPEVASQGDDCNDLDPTIHPNQPESRCDGIDDNCSGEIDEGLRITAYRDRDHDLFGDPASGVLACPRDVVGELTDNNFDCDDTDPTVNPPAGNCP